MNIKYYQPRLPHGHHFEHPSCCRSGRLAAAAGAAAGAASAATATAVPTGTIGVAVAVVRGTAARLPEPQPIATRESGWG